MEYRAIDPSWVKNYRVRILDKSGQDSRVWTYQTANAAHTKANSIADALALPYAYDVVTAMYTFDMRQEEQA